jgi:hypothetical protein
VTRKPPLAVAGILLAAFVMVSCEQRSSTSGWYEPLPQTYQPPPPEPKAPSPAATYVVQPGDGWYRIAAKNGTTLQALLMANDAPSDALERRVMEGQHEVLVPLEQLRAVVRVDLVHGCGYCACDSSWRIALAKLGSNCR